MGRIVMDDLKEWCHITKSSFSSKPEITAFNEGKRFIYLRIIEMSKLNLDQIMQKEAGSDTRKSGPVM